MTKAKLLVMAEHTKPISLIILLFPQSKVSVATSKWCEL